jgi:hypothetical protein
VNQTLAEAHLIFLWSQVLTFHPGFLTDEQILCKLALQLQQPFDLQTAVCLIARSDVMW